MNQMHPLLLPFIAVEAPVFFLFAATVIFLRRRRPDSWLAKLMAFEFPLVAIGGLGLPLWAAYAVLAAR